MTTIDNLILDACGKYLLIGGMHVCAYYYMLAECDNDIGFDRIERLEANNRVLSELINDVFSGNTDLDDLKERAVELRKDVKESMHDIVAYIDNAHLLEYILLRTKTGDGRPLKEINDDAVARDILTAIFKSDSNAVINDNIRKVVSQLPVRMTKDKYRDVLRNELKSYIGQPKPNIDRVMYMIRSSAGISGYPKYVIDDFEEDYRKLQKYTEPGISESDKDYACAQINDLIEYMGDFRDGVELQMKVIDYLLVYLMNYEEADPEYIDSVLDLKEIIDASEDVFKYGAPEQMPASVMKSFDELAGRAEAEYGYLEKVISKIAKEQQKERTLSDGIIYDDRFFMERFAICDKLLSGSAFADIDVEKDQDTSPLTEEEFDRMIDGFMSDLNKAGASDSKAMLRARMASTFTCIPPFFSNRTEVMHYVLDSLKGCRDIYEKTASVEQVKSFLEE
ncbi:MAG: hypothetical protein K6G81_07455 [Lachnospiraceae bacterium]|nr:hypothetical protein [Lachnospiraceae bacterium]